MKYILAILLVFGLGYSYAQAPLLFSSRLNVTNVTGSDPYTLTGVVQDELSLWSAADINATADSIYHLEGSDLLIYRITSISSAVGNNFTIIVDDIMNSGILPSTGTEWCAVEFTTNYQFPVEVGNLATNFKATIDNRFKQRLDSALDAAADGNGIYGGSGLVADGTKAYFYSNTLADTLGFLGTSIDNEYTGAEIWGFESDAESTQKAIIGIYDNGWGLNPTPMMLYTQPDYHQFLTPNEWITVSPTGVRNLLLAPATSLQYITDSPSHATEKFINYYADYSEQLKGKPRSIPDMGTVREVVDSIKSVIKPYKVYTAFLTQTGTNAPVATVMENTLGGTVVWTRSDVGIYIGTLAGVFTASKCFPYSFKSTNTFTEVSVERLDSNSIIVSLTDTVLGLPIEISTIGEAISVEIRVYP